MNKKWLRIIIIFIFLAAIFRFGFESFSQSTRLISSPELDNVLKSAVSAQMDDDLVLIRLADGNQVGIYASDEVISKVLEKLPLAPESANILHLLLGALLVILLCMLVLNIIERMRAAKQNQQGINQLNLIKQSKPETFVSFDDVLGAHVAKKELLKLVDRLHKAAPMRALLFAGASGVGKTMLARALSCAANCAFHYASASSFNELYVGMGAKRIRDLFAQANATKPCIIFIDEIDALGASRGNLLNKESEHTLNELLVQMDGFASSTGVLLIAATNRADVLDPALLRRFYKKIEFSLPNEAERAEFVQAYHLVPALAKEQAVALTNGFSGADFAAVGAELEDSKILDEATVLKAIAERRFGLSSTAFFSKEQAHCEAAVWTVAELLGAEVYHVAGRAIWQLNLQPSRQQAHYQAQILLAASEASKHFFDDEYAFNKYSITQAQNALKDYARVDEPFLKTSSELNQMMQNASAAAADLVKMHEELIIARAKLLEDEAQIFVQKEDK